MKKKFFVILSFILFISILFVGCVKNDKTEGNREGKTIDTHQFNLFLDEENNRLRGSQKVFYHLPDDGLEHIAFQLHANAYKDVAVSEDEIKSAYPEGLSFGGIEIFSVKVDEEVVAPKFCGKNEVIMEIPLSSKKGYNEEIEIEIDWEITFPQIKHRLGVWDGVYNLGNFYPVPCVYQNGFVTNDFYTLGDPYFSDIAKFEFDFDIPSQYTLACGGALSEITPLEKGRKNVKFKGEKMRDVGFVLSDKFVMRSAMVKDCKITYYYLDDKTPLDTINHAKTALEFFEDTFGEYPYKSYGIAQAPFAFGGMEYSGFCLVSPHEKQEDYFYTLTHETAHQWWYSKVGNNQILESWLDESLTEFSTFYFYKNKSEKTYKSLVEKAYDNYIFYSGITGKTGEGSEVENSLEKFTSYSYYYNVYVKGALMFDSLYKIKGETFISALCDYGEKYAFSISNRKKFINSLENSLQCELESYFAPWLEGKVLICKY